jgi:hypothetical protein
VGDAAPRPILAALDEPGADRVVEHVVDRSREVFFVADHPRPEAFGEERAEASVAGVVLAGVVAVQPLHRLRELFRLGLDDDVVVGRHQAPGLQAEAEAPDRPPEVEQEEDPVRVVAEERRVGDTPGRHVEVAIRKARPKHASHRPILRPPTSTYNGTRSSRPTSDTASRAATGVRHPSWLQRPRP